ncbi:MAG: hypothetical protein MUP19_10400, partial [Candidatus Aminicenantes bacterium]|nr:hypothetical protein [Candidatus Aminicenantes bacterium]
GLVRSLDAGEGRNVLRGLLLEPLVVEDLGDSWGADVWNYKKILGRFKPEGKPRIVQEGPVRRITESVLSYGRSRVVFRTIAYTERPVLEFRLRVIWAEEKKRLKLSVPTVIDAPYVLAEVPGGAINRPADGEEHVHGAWLFLKGEIKGREVGLGLANNGQPGFDFFKGEVRLSVLRSAAYCHDKGFSLGESPARKYMDQGVHDIGLVVTVGGARDVLESLPSLADRLNAPPPAYAHLPFGSYRPADSQAVRAGMDWLRLDAPNVGLLACKQSEDGEALIIRLQEAAGLPTRAILSLGEMSVEAALDFRPFEIKTIRIERSGAWRETDVIKE